MDACGSVIVNHLDFQHKIICFVLDSHGTCVYAIKHQWEMLSLNSVSLLPSLQLLGPNFLSVIAIFKIFSSPTEGVKAFVSVVLLLWSFPVFIL